MASKPADLNSDEASGQEGVPPTLTLEFARDWARSRVSGKRYQHICGVARVAAELAAESGCSVFLAELAGWLHDICKEIKDSELITLAKRFGLTLHPTEIEHGHLLHGPVAAEMVKSELGLTCEPVLDAIRQHTLGAAPMSDVSKVVYLADCLEPGRPSDYTKPIWRALKQEGQLDLNKALVVACDLNLRHLLDGGKPIHPRTVEVRNYYLDLLKKRPTS